MTDKSRLELAIEEREQYRVTLFVKSIIVLLIAALGVLGAYTLGLKKELAGKDREIRLMREEFQREKVEILRRIKRLEGAEATDKQ